MAAYKHYRNCKEFGVTLFVTTTVLDFAHAFRREEMREAMAFHLVRECKLAGVALYGFVIMPHHIHMVVRLPEKLTGPEFMREFKANTSKAIKRLLIEPERRDFDQQSGLNRRTFWKYSYRSVKIEGERMLWEKINYIHQNPVEAGYVIRPEDYRWSSARFILEGQWSDEEGLPIDQTMKTFGAWGAG